jgi:AraC-like DNA-binding protein
MDVLTEILSSLRLSGGVFIDAELRAPFSVVSQVKPEHCGAHFPVPRRIIGYHYVRSGSFKCVMQGMPPLVARQGAVVLIPRNQAHHLQSLDAGAPSVDSRMLVEQDGAMLRIRGGGAGDTTLLYCGYLGTNVAENPLLDALPSMLVIDTGAEAGGWIARSLDFAAEGLSGQSPEMVGKLAEILFAEAVRHYVAELPAEASGWLAGLRDPAVSRALSLIHARYAEGWTLDQLARETGVSRTVLAERFRTHLGESPMQYCSRWRMRVAADLLREDRHNACSVAYSVGFNSEAAFNRAFKREYGAPPATWRRSLETA